MRVLVACEYSARVRDAFAAAGHYAVSCDLEPTEGDPAWHVQGDVRALFTAGTWDLLIAFPPCTYLTKSNAWRWDAIADERAAALSFVREIMDAPIPRVAVENPAGAIGTHIRKADQYVQPWQFGEPYQKLTGLWLRGLPTLTPEIAAKPPDVQPWCQGTYAGHRGYGTHRRSRERSRTFFGIARAMATQWGIA